MKLVVAATALMAILGTVNGFVGTTTARQSLVTSRHMAEESAQAMTDYLAKSHEEKIRAIKEIETKKNAEIEVSPNKWLVMMGCFIVAKVRHIGVSSIFAVFQFDVFRCLLITCSLHNNIFTGS